jgi:hypothetical protein
MDIHFTVLALTGTENYGTAGGGHWLLGERTKGETWSVVEC